MAPPSQKRIAGRSTASSGAVIKKGQQGVIKDSDTKDAQKKLRLSTQRALVLREAIMGKGEVKISGREKLELLVEDSMKTNMAQKLENITALRAPFEMSKLLKWAQAMMDGCIDKINGLHDVELCSDIVDRHIRSQVPDGPNATPFRDKTQVASQFGFCVHNAYMMTSAWTLVYECLRELQKLGIQDKKVLDQLKSSKEIRVLYMLVWDMVKKIVKISQDQLRSVAQNTKHFADYFQDVADRKDGTQQFNNAELREMYKSYLDSIIIELCLPGSRFSPAALYQCLHDVVEEAPKELKRCPQAMWDAVGDMGQAVRLLDLLETPLLAPEGRSWMEEYERIEEPYEFYKWVEAQDASIRACQIVGKLEGLLTPITNLKSLTSLNKVWGEIKANYLAESGMDIDALWQVDIVRKRVPQWSYNWMDLNPVAEESEDEGGAPKPRSGKKGRLQLTDGKDDGYKSDDSMPGLLDVSDSEDEEDEDAFMSESSEEESDDEDDDDYETDTSGYNSEEDEELRQKFRRAMNMYNENPDAFDGTSVPEDKYATERKTNPFLKLLGSLKGRMFQKGSALRTDGKTTKAATAGSQKSGAKPATKPATKSSAGKSGASSALVVDDMPPLEPLTKTLGKTTLDEKSKKTTVEDADDESDDAKVDKKKKKKKPKKKKKKPSAAAASTDEIDEVEPPTTAGPGPASPAPSAAAAISPTPPPESPAKKKQTPSIKSNSSGTTAKATSISSSTAAGSVFGGSTYSLATEQKAESARSYLASLNAEKKEKVKTRPDQPAEGGDEKKSLFKKLGFRGKESKDKEAEAPKKVERSPNVFVGLKKKSKLCAQKLFGLAVEDRKGSLKWDSFVKLMEDLGFEYDKSTAGSSVRFDPPSGKDRSITFHKPHPDPTLHQNHLKEFRKKLIDYYDWSPEQLKMMDNKFGGHSAEVD